MMPPRKMPITSPADCYAITSCLEFYINLNNNYKDNLSPGQLAMLKQYPTYKLNVFTSRRTASYPEGHYKETKECAAKAKLAAGGNGVVGCTGGTPFPIPANGNDSSTIRSCKTMPWLSRHSRSRRGRVRPTSSITSLPILGSKSN